ncbi:MAG: hypothetical protein R2710_11590 [Acidimicrobiales bacterium]
MTRRIEAPIAKKTMNVDTYGVSPTGVYEWYRTKKLRRILSGWESSPVETSVRWGHRRKRQGSGSPNRHRLRRSPRSAPACTTHRTPSMPSSTD